jgi:orotate phosphoribosyltransferase
LVEGAFIGLLAASQMGVDFAYSERYKRDGEGGLFTVGYRVPDSLRSRVRHRRVAIVNDVINAGSAVRGTFDDLQTCGSTVVAVGALLVLGTAAQDFAGRTGIALESIAAMPNELWAESECPLCASGVALEDVAGFRTEWG